VLGERVYISSRREAMEADGFYHPTLDIDVNS
jgi:hypothetical protein